MQECHPVLDVVRIDDVVVVEHQHDVVRQPAEVVEQRGKDRCRSAVGATRSRESAVAPTSGTTVCSAAIT